MTRFADHDAALAAYLAGDLDVYDIADRQSAIVVREALASHLEGLRPFTAPYADCEATIADLDSEFGDVPSPECDSHLY